MSAPRNAARVVVALSGGGAKAVAHVGAMRALAEAGIEPAVIVGTSMGAVIGAGFAAGLGAAAMLERISRVTRRSVAAPVRLAALGGLWLPSLLQEEPLRRTIRSLVPSSGFDALRIPLGVCAVDLETGQLELFGAGGRPATLADALYASCALPMYYPAARIDGRRYADGGLRGALPLEAASRFPADMVVAVDVGPGFDGAAELPAPGVPAMVRAHDEATGTLMAAATETQCALWRATPGRPRLVYVRPRVERNATFRVERAALYVEEGYAATRRALCDLDP